jgi:hypothetical protein
MMKHILYLLLLANLGMHNSEALASDQRDDREFKMAEQAILVSLIATKSNEGRKACLDNSLACSDDRAELGLLVLKEKRSTEALSHLIKIMRYPMDAGFSEGYVCYVAEKGKTAIDSIRKVNEKQLHSQCIQETNILVNENYKDIIPNSFCASEDNMRKKKKELLEMVSKGVKCDSRDY